MDFQDYRRTFSGYQQSKKRIDQDPMIWAEAIAVLVSDVGVSLDETLNLTVAQFEILLEGYKRTQEKRTREHERQARR